MNKFQSHDNISIKMLKIYYSFTEPIILNRYISIFPDIWKNSL